MPKVYTQEELDDLGSYFSDYHKEIYGTRPRYISFSDGPALEQGIADLESYMTMRKSTKEGRNELREEGWYIEEFMEEDGWDQKAYEQRQDWFYEEMEREMEQSYAVTVPRIDPEDNILALIKNALTMKWATA